jgi:hypothetical protein
VALLPPVGLGFGISKASIPGYSFDSSTAISSMNSRWNAKKNCAMVIEAAAMLNFGSSLFILKDGEDKQTRQKKEKGVIERGNLRPEDIGGVEADNLASLGKALNTETVFNVSDDEYGDDDIAEDDVSCLDHDEGFSDDSKGDESTVAQDEDEDDDVEMEDSQGDDYDQDSAFSTEDGLDSLKKGGRKIARDFKQHKIDQLEAEKAESEAAIVERIKRMEMEMVEKMDNIEMHYKQKYEDMLASAQGNNFPTPGVEATAAKEGSISLAKGGNNSQNAADFDALAAIK